MSLNYTSEICIILTLITGLCTFLPILLKQGFDGAHLFSTLDLNDTMMFHVSLVATFSAAMPMTLDTLLDFRLPLRAILPHWSIVAALGLPGIITYIAYYTGGKTGAISISFMCLLAREMILRGSLLSYLLYDGCSWKTVTTVGGVWLMTAFSLQVLVWRTFRPDIIPHSWNTCGRILSLFSAIVVSGMVIIRLRKARTPSCGANSETYVILYPVLFALNILLKFCILFTTNDMAYSGFVDMFVCILATTIPGRQARQEKAIAEHIIESKRNYVSYVSHEIRTPLNAAYMGIQLLAKECNRGLKESAEFWSILDDVDTSCRVAIDILNEFLLANKLEAGKVSLEKELVGAAELIRSVADPFGVQARQKGVEFLHDGDSHLDPVLITNDVHINVDARKVGQVLRNLISNALKFTPRGGRVDVYAYLTTKSQASYSGNSLFSIPHSSVQPIASSFNEGNLSSTRKSSEDRCYDLDNNVLRIEVHDSGVGISPENQLKLFGEIVQFNAAQLQNGGGSGIGLWISKKIVDLHGGRIGVTSELGKGSMFFVELDEAKLEPFSTKTLAVKSSVKDISSRRLLASSSNRSICQDCIGVVRDINVLIVDDSAVNRKMLTRLIEPSVGHISQAENGLEAVSKVRETMSSNSSLDLIFMDATMPEMCGTDATVLIREMGFVGMIVFLTGNAMPEDILRFKAVGANDVIAKPCTIESVERILLSVGRQTIDSSGSVCDSI